MREAAWREIDRRAPELWELALRLHANPELGYEEHQAAGWLSEFLEREGFQVERGLAGLSTAFRARYPAAAPGARLAVLAEYDALPELGHACGHNLIAAGAVGAALGLAVVKDQLPGELFVIGSPAEEGGGGKIRLIEAGVFRGLDTAFMFHPASETVVDRGSLAITEVEIAFRGVAAHASSQPDRGVNALDGVIQTFVALNALRQHMRDGARVHGIITDGGQKPNIVPEHAAARFYVRAADNAYRDYLLGALERCAQGAALATGAELDFRAVGHAYKAMRSNAALAESMARHLEDLGEPPVTPTGGLGSTDMGDVSWEVPSLHPYVRITEEAVPGHSRAFAEASCGEGGRRGMLVAAKAMAALAVDLWTDPALLERVRQAFGR